jgi:hypothetical protein
MKNPDASPKLKTGRVTTKRQGFQPSLRKSVNEASRLSAFSADANVNEASRLSAFRCQRSVKAFSVLALKQLEPLTLRCLKTATALDAALT